MEPPHRRGKVAVNQCFDQALRITPAQAGKRTEGSRYTPESEDHPRTSGEKGEQTSTLEVKLGSPPRGRGKGQHGILVPVRHGITPAWAGKSLFCFTAAVPIQDHPRVGGEKSISIRFAQDAAGSPPHRRGKAFRQTGLLLPAGITPAWAGKRLSPVTPYNPPSDYPRAGGEKVQLRSGKQTQKGSHPHGRGKGRRVVDHHPLPRITPAWAGKSNAIFEFS